MADVKKTAEDCEQATAAEPATAGERITVTLIPKAAADLRRLRARTSLSKTDIVNRGVSLYEFISAQLEDGKDLVIRDRASGETHLVTFL